MVGAALCLSPPAAAPCAPGELGSLTLHGPFPCLARTVWVDHDRYVETSLSEFPGKYAADAALLDQDGQLWVTGRLDDIKGAVPVAFVVPRNGIRLDTDLTWLENELADAVVSGVGALARPGRVVVTPTVPRTRSG